MVKFTCESIYRKNDLILLAEINNANATTRPGLMISPMKLKKICSFSFILFAYGSRGFLAQNEEIEEET